MVYTLRNLGSFLAEIISILAKVELFTYINDVLIILRMVFKLCIVVADYIFTKKSKSVPRVLVNVNHLCDYYIL